jgi:hypothetical protein
MRPEPRPRKLVGRHWDLLWTLIQRAWLDDFAQRPALDEFDRALLERCA